MLSILSYSIVIHFDDNQAIMLGGYLPYAIVLLGTAVVLAALAGYAWERRDRLGATPLTVFLLGECLWCLCAFASIVTRGTAWAPFWTRAWFVGVVLTVAGLFVFALEYTGRQQYLGRRTYLALSVQPILYLGTIAFGPEELVHDAVARTSETMTGWVIEEGLAFWIHSAYSYVLLVVTTALLINFALTSNTLRRRQAVALIASILIPWFGNVVYLFTDIGFDPTPMAFSVSGVAITWAVFRGGLLDISPVAHREVVRSLNSAVIVVDVDGRISEVNEAATELLGGGQIVGTDVESALAEWPELREQLTTAAWDAQSGVEIQQQGRYFQVQGSRLVDDRGDSIGRVFQIHDITDQKTRELELERRNRQLDQFASVVSHDLRNPLSVASGSLELARRTGDSDHFDRVERAHERMHGLIEQVLSLSRDEEEMELQAHPFEELTRTAWAHVDTKEATLTVDATEEIVADRDQLLQLLENAFRNSVEHAGSDCRISVRTVHESPGSDPAVDGFMISDDGRGIPPDERESLFDQGYTTEADGTGLGLAIIERITRAHDWSIRATEGPEGGLALVVSGVEFHRVRSATPSA